MAKEPTEKQLAARKAFGEAARARAEAKKEKAVVTEATQTTVQNEDYNSLKAQVDELTAMLKARVSAEANAGQLQQQSAQITSTGLIGTLKKFNTDPNYYPNPTTRLYDEPRLARFAFKENWELEFSVKDSSYTTLDNRRVVEPQFTIQLIGKMYDDDGNLTPGRYVRKQMVFFEDPDAALAIAREQGIDVESFGEKEFLDEMRYLRVRNWLLENFYPPTNTNKQQNKKQMVVNNQVVEYYEISSVDSAEVNFNGLNGKLKG